MVLNIYKNELLYNLLLYFIFFMFFKDQHLSFHVSANNSNNYSNLITIKEILETQKEIQYSKTINNNMNNGRSMKMKERKEKEKGEKERLKREQNKECNYREINMIMIIIIMMMTQKMKKIWLIILQFRFQQLIMIIQLPETQDLNLQNLYMMMQKQNKNRMMQIKQNQIKK